jgi:capsular polysaccharide biosynthesis protein
MQGNDPSYYNDYEEIDLRDIFKTINKWKHTIIAVTLICVLLSGIFSFFVLDPVYEASTVVSIYQAQLNRENESTNDIADTVNELGEIPYMSAVSCEQQVKSPAIMEAVIKKLQLPYTRNGLKSSIKTQQVQNTNLIIITVSNNNPELAATIANTLREEFILHINRINKRKMAQSLEIMEKEWLQKEEVELDIASEKLKEHKLQSRSIEFLSSQLGKKREDLINYQSWLAKAEIDRASQQEGIKQLQETIAHTPHTLTTVNTANGILPADLQGIDIKDGTVSSEQINMNYTSLMDAYNSKTTALAELTVQISKTRQEIARQEKEILDLEAELIRNQLGEKKLQNEVSRRESVVTLLSSKIAELKMTESINLADNNIITVSEAMVPEAPVKPNKMLNMAIAAVLGLMLATFSIFLIEYLRGNGTNKSESEESKGFTGNV